MKKTSDPIERQDAINAITEMGFQKTSTVKAILCRLEALPSAQSETYKEKLNKIASALSEKFAYMNTCLNERDIILGYLGVKRSCKIHCNTDCTNTRCVSHPLSSAQSETCTYWDRESNICALHRPPAQLEIIRCKDCKHWSINKRLNTPWCRAMHIDRGAEDFCSDAERRTDG